MEPTSDRPDWVKTILDEFEELKRRLPPVRQEWFSIKGAAILTGLSTATVRRSVVGGTLPASNMGTSDHPIYRLRYTDLEAWMEKRKAGAFPPPRRKKAAAEPVPYVSRHHRPQPPKPPKSKA